MQTSRLTLKRCFMDKKRLHMLRPNEKAIVVDIESDGSIKRRFLDMGVVPECEIECTLESPFHDPKAYLIRGAVIAIRNQDAKGIIIEQKEDQNEKTKRN